MHKELMSEEELRRSDRYRELLTVGMQQSGMSKSEIAKIKDEIYFKTITLSDLEKIEFSGETDLDRSRNAIAHFYATADNLSSFEPHGERNRSEWTAFLERLVKNSEGTIKSVEDAFKLFARANFSGNYLPAARVVEKIYGKGSFRKLGIEFGWAIADQYYYTD